MKIKDITLDDEEYPAAITAVMSIREAALIARMIGPTTDSGRAKFQYDGGAVGTEIWNALCGGVFNRFWDDGVDEVPK